MVWINDKIYISTIEVYRTPFKLDITITPRPDGKFCFQKI